MVAPKSAKHIVGELCEAHFQYEALKRHWQVCKPFGHAQPYDFVIRRPGQGWETVQVKSVHKHKKGGNYPVVNLRKRTQGAKSAKYAPGEFDLMAAVYLETGQVWLIPFPCFKYQTTNFGLRSAPMFLLGATEPDFSDIDGLTEACRTITLTSSKRKLSPEIVAAFKADCAAGAGYPALSKKYKIAQSSVGRIVRGEAYLDAA